LFWRQKPRSALSFGKDPLLLKADYKPHSGSWWWTNRID
jgi:hypothetical protein